MGVSRTDLQCLYLHAWGAVHGSRLCLAHIYAWYVYRKLRQTLFHDFSWFLEWIPNTEWTMYMYVYREDTRTTWEAPHNAIWMENSYVNYHYGLPSMQLQVGPEYGGFWPPSSEIAGIDSRNFERTSCPQCWFDFERFMKVFFDVSRLFWFNNAPFVLICFAYAEDFVPAHEVYEELVVASTVWRRYVVLKAGMELKVEAVPCCVKAHAWHKLLDSVG